MKNQPSYPRVFAILLTVCTMVSPAISQSIVQVIPLPSSTYYNSAWGLTADTSSLYISSNTSNATEGRKIIKLSFAGSALDSVFAPAGVVSSQGLAKDDSGNFFYLRRYTSAGTIMKIDPLGTIVDSMRISKFLGGVAWDGTHVWYSVYSPDVESGLYKVDFATKTVVDTVLVPTQQPYGITWDGQYLYYVENGFQGDPRGIFRVDPIGHDTAGFIPEPMDGTSNGTNPRDVAWDGQYMWLLGEPVGASTGRAIYKYDLAGTGTPDINLSSTLVDYAGVRLGSSKLINVSIQNVGTGPLSIDSVIVGLSANVVASISTPLTIQPSGVEILPLTFFPQVYGLDSAVVRIYSDDPDEGTKNLPARGFGIFGSPTISLPASLNYGLRRVGSNSPMTMTIQNLGAEALSITAINNDNPEFYLDPVTLPVTVDSLGNTSFRVWFQPSSGVAFTDTLKITSNAVSSLAAVTNVLLTGTGDPTGVPIGQPLWSFTVPDHPSGSNFGRLVKGVRAIDDITGDGKADVVVSTENYWTMALNGNGSITTDTLWAFSTYISNSSAGSIGTTGDYSHQKALGISGDLNSDGYRDVVIGTGGGNEHVYAISGKTGQMLWTFGTDHPDSFGLGDFTGIDVARDFDGDLIPDVVAAASATQSGGTGGRRSVYLFKGNNGTILWQSALPGFTHGVISVGDISGDNMPDVVGAVGEPAYKATAFNGLNGNLLWDFPLTSGSGGGKEVMEFPVSGQSPDIILGAFWGPVYRVDGATGVEMWNHPTGGVGGGGVMQLAKLPDVTGDGVDEILVALLGNGALCLNGANGNTVWSRPTGNTMGIASIPDLNQDSTYDVAIAVQNTGTMIVKGQDGADLALFPTGTNQSREVAVVPDIDDNFSLEIIVGSREGNIYLLSGGLEAGPTSVDGEFQNPAEFSLAQNYPNPFNPSTSIKIQLPEQSDLSVRIFDVVGRLVRSFDYERVPAGIHTVEWNGSANNGVQVSSGVYFYQAVAGSKKLARKMILMR